MEGDHEEVIMNYMQEKYMKKMIEVIMQQIDTEIKSLVFPKLYKKYRKHVSKKKDDQLHVGAIPNISIKKYDRPKN